MDASADGACRTLANGLSMLLLFMTVPLVDLGLEIPLEHDPSHRSNRRFDHSLEFELRINALTYSVIGAIAHR